MIGMGDICVGKTTSLTSETEKTYLPKLICSLLNEFLNSQWQSQKAWSFIIIELF